MTNLPRKEEFNTYFAHMDAMLNAVKYPCYGGDLERAPGIHFDILANVFGLSAKVVAGVRLSPFLCRRLRRFTLVGKRACLRATRVSQNIVEHVLIIRDLLSDGEAFRALHNAHVVVYRLPSKTLNTLSITRTIVHALESKDNLMAFLKAGGVLRVRPLHGLHTFFAYNDELQSVHTIAIEKHYYSVTSTHDQKFAFDNHVFYFLKYFRNDTLQIHCKIN